MMISSVNTGGKSGAMPSALIPSANNQPRKDPTVTEPPGLSAVDSATAKKIMESLQQKLETTNVTISFSRYGRDSQNVAVTIAERDTGKVVREIPPQEIQRLSLKMEELIGIIFNDLA